MTLCQSVEHEFVRKGQGAELVFFGIPQRQGNTCSPWAPFAPDLSHCRSQWSSACLPSCKAAPSQTCCKHADKCGQETQPRDGGLGARTEKKRAEPGERPSEEMGMKLPEEKETDMTEQVLVHERENPTLKLQETPQSLRDREKKRENERRCERRWGWRSAFCVISH